MSKYREVVDVSGVGTGYQPGYVPIPSMLCDWCRRLLLALNHDAAFNHGTEARVGRVEDSSSRSCRVCHLTEERKA
jgi:hypothetical protein